MDRKTPGNITYGDQTANYRMRYKQMLEEHNSKTNKKKINKKKNENPIDKITRILYGGSNKRVYTKTYTLNVEELKEDRVNVCVKKVKKVRQQIKHLSELKKLAKRKWLKSYMVRCDRNIVITRYIGA